jgi:aspartate ammonia-lyase
MDALKQLREKSDKELTKNEDECQRLHALYIASTTCLKNQNGIEACELLVKSERTMQELKKVVDSNGGIIIY